MLLESVDRLGVDQSGKQLSVGENTLLVSSVTSTSRRHRRTQGWRSRGAVTAATDDGVVQRWQRRGAVTASGDGEPVALPTAAASLSDRVRVLMQANLVT